MFKYFIDPHGRLIVTGDIDHYFHKRSPSKVPKYL